MFGYFFPFFSPFLLFHRVLWRWFQLLGGLLVGLFFNKVQDFGGRGFLFFSRLGVLSPEKPESSET